jgi:isopenicillin N synthase-like dioxygenase
MLNSIIVDHKEGFGWQYSPNLDPLYDSLPKPIPASSIPPESLAYIRAEDHLWEETAKLPGFNEAAFAYYRACLQLARRLTKVFALALDLPEDYFEKLTTYPGADLAFNYYPGFGPISDSDKDGLKTGLSKDVGLGSHTDLQCFTLLYQDMIGGLLVLNRQGEWIKATPVKDTFVVNIGDFLMRMTNDKWMSTVHRVEVNRSSEPRVSMPLFFGS